MDKRLYWNYDHKYKWQQIERPYLESTLDISDFLEKQDFLLDPDIVIGDEFNFICLYDHPFTEEFLFHLVIDDFSKILYANSLPAMIELMQILQKLMRDYFATLEAVNELGEGKCLD